jgi:DNA-binding response OmpR family regulator
MTTENEMIQNLRARVAELEEELRQLREDTVKVGWVMLGNLSKQQSALLMAISKLDIAPYRHLDHITEEHGKYNRYEGEMHQTLRTKVAVWKLRQKLKRYSIEIKTLRGVGYFMDDDNKAKLQALMEKK